MGSDLPYAETLFCTDCSNDRARVRRKDTQFRKAVLVEVRIAAVLFRLATGQNYFHVSERFGIGSSTIQETMYEVTMAIILLMGPQYLRWPVGHEMEEVSAKFYRKCGLPNVQGAIDGTFIHIATPLKDAALYFNRKQYHSLVMQAVADIDGVFMDISCGMPSSTNDRRVLQQSRFLEKVNIGEILSEPVMLINGSFPLRPYVLGDAGYYMKLWLVMPYRLNPRSSDLQEMFTERQIRGRLVIEQAFRVLKARWQILIVGITSSMNWSGRIVQACVILHNVLVKNRVASGSRASEVVDMLLCYRSLGVNRPRLGASRADVRNALCEFLALT